MPEPAPRWILDDSTATAECRLNGRLMYVLEQRREADLSAVEAAAVIESLRSLADGLEASCLDRQAGEVLAEVDVAVTIEDESANVG